MDFPLFLKALILGVVEGLTEFLPISSTGHLIIVEDLLRFNGEKAKVFAIFIQLGAILAVCWEFRAKLASVILGLPSEPESRHLAFNLIIAFIPAAILGFLFHSSIKEYLFSPLTVAAALIIGGLIIFWVESIARIPRVKSIDEMSWRDALKIGLAQSLALFPGVSRSGATIIGGLVFGLTRETATVFSFFLAIPTMFAAVSYDLLKNRGLLSIDDAGVFAIGFIAAFLSGLLAVKALLRFVSTHSFAAFAWYRIVLGAVVMAYFW